MMGGMGNENDFKDEQETREDHNGEDVVESSSSFLSDLNLLFVLLSLISPNTNEDSNDGNGVSTRMKEIEGSTTYNIAKSSIRKKDVIEAQHESRRKVPQRFHTTIKDHRFFSIYQFLLCLK